ncbi:unnamed protein product [Rotaria sordida]|uniref:Uncharacterized protein n=2 Tax=Rotaria sordida TaxID=392033 RepID=A0A815FAI1_9BILA|nr:unnamed protein product [Rotaria sordida]CAF1589133.1 unnamed protein product [Rotaria sordida]
MYEIDLNDLLLETEILQNEFYNILLIISSSDDNKKQLLFVKLQNYLSTFVEINLYFKKSDQCLSIITCLSNKSSIIISSSFFSNDDVNKDHLCTAEAAFVDAIFIKKTCCIQQIVPCSDSRTPLTGYFVERRLQGSSS